MIRIRCARPIGLVTAIAVRRQRCVVVVGVALCARNSRVRSGQRKHRGVIEGRRAPRGRRVAQRTIGRESRSCVVRIRGAVEVGLMASIAGCRRSRIDIVDMAGGAR